MIVILNERRVDGTAGQLRSALRECRTVEMVVEPTTLGGLSGSRGLEDQVAEGAVVLAKVCLHVYQPVTAARKVNAERRAFLANRELGAKLLGHGSVVTPKLRCHLGTVAAQEQRHRVLSKLIAKIAIHAENCLVVVIGKRRPQDVIHGERHHGHREGLERCRQDALDGRRVGGVGEIQATLVRHYGRCAKLLEVCGVHAKARASGARQEETAGSLVTTTCSRCDVPVAHSGANKANTDAALTQTLGKLLCRPVPQRKHHKVRLDLGASSIGNALDSNAIGPNLN